jgi:hypothetical protein
MEIKEINGKRAITLYLVNQTSAYRMCEQGEYWDYEPYHSGSSYYEGDTVKEADFYLPDGYYVGEDWAGDPALAYGDTIAQLITNNRGNPVLCGASKSRNGDILERVK